MTLSAISRAHRLSQRLGQAEDLDSMLDVALDSLAELWGFSHCMILIVEPGQDRMVTLASRGYARAGVGSEVDLGKGTIGVAAQRRQAVRIGNLSYAMRYHRAARTEMTRTGSDEGPYKEVPLPGLKEPNSQLAVPMIAQGSLVGVVHVESEAAGAFDDLDEQALAIAANQLGATIALSTPGAEVTSLQSEQQAEASRSTQSAPPLEVRYYDEDCSVFLDGEYLIKSLPGRILWSLLSQYKNDGRMEFTNKGLRLDASLKLPPVKDNLETRLILLRRRLDERSNMIRIVRTGRGRFLLVVEGDLELQRVGVGT